MPDAGLEELANELGLSKKERVPFQRSLCCLRNVMVDGITFPEANPWERKMEIRWANRALDFLRGEPDLPRSRFAMICHVRIAGHELGALWDKAEHLAASFIPHGLSYSERIAVPPPRAEVDEIGALARLLNYYDPDEDAFRYPSALDGRWHSELPHLDLVGLGELASRMHDTVLCVRDLRRDAYQQTTVSQPSPFVVLGVV